MTGGYGQPPPDLGLAGHPNIVTRYHTGYTA